MRRWVSYLCIALAAQNGSGGEGEGPLAQRGTIHDVLTPFTLHHWVQALYSLCHSEQAEGICWLKHCSNAVPRGKPAGRVTAGSARLGQEPVWTYRLADSLWAGFSARTAASPLQDALGCCKP